MGLRILRAVAGLLLGASGALMFAASWQRWAGACPWGDLEAGRCLTRQDDRYDFLAPTDPWEPLGHAAQLAGSSLLVLALGFTLLPWALPGRRPSALSAAALVAAVLALGMAGVDIVRSGLAGSVVSHGLVLGVGFLLPPVLVVRFAADARGWPLAAAVPLFLGMPLVGSFTYGIGPYDARPWWEAISGLSIAAAGVCLLVAAAVSGRSRGREPAVALASRG